MSGSAALVAADFERLMRPFAPFERNPSLAVAVSGGRDSLALALLARDWVRARDGRLVALVVDHGLRAEAAAEAKSTRATLGRLGIESRILRWQGPKPRTGLQQAARAARYRLLFEACRSTGLLHLLVAHHASDQAETVAMRAGRGSGPDGLAGMAALVEHRDLRLLRPLLEVPRDRLTATLEAANVKWIEDPSNTDQRFERARLRRDGVESDGGTISKDAAEARTRAERRLADAMVGLVEVAEAGAALDRAGYARLGAALRERVLGRLVQALAGSDHPPRRERLARAAARLAAPPARGKSGRASDFTFAACRLTLRQVPGSRRLRWLVWRENGQERGNNAGQPLVPAAFFGCGAASAHHVD